jgi:hypothetical protein
MCDQSPQKKCNASHLKATCPSRRQEGLEEFWVVLQEGGTSGECYGEAYETEIAAKRAVACHERASYRAICVRVAVQRRVTIEQAGDIAGAMAEAALAFRALHEPSGYRGKGMSCPSGSLATV